MCLEPLRAIALQLWGESAAWEVVCVVCDPVCGITPLEVLTTGCGLLLHISVTHLWLQAEADEHHPGPPGVHPACTRQSSGQLQGSKRVSW